MPGGKLHQFRAFYPDTPFFKDGQSGIVDEAKPGVVQDFPGGIGGDIDCVALHDTPFNRLIFKSFEAVPKPLQSVVGYVPDPWYYQPQNRQTAAFHLWVAGL